MKVYEGSILTVDERDTVARYLVEDGGLIAYVGDALPKQYADAAREHLGNRALCPSFVDTHQHFASLATFNAGLNVMEARSNDEIQRLVAEFSRTYAGKVLIAFGASPYSVAEGRLLSRAELDEACPDKPVMMVKYDGHACVVNSALLGLIEGRVSDQRGYHPDTGEMNQEAFFKALDYITGSISIPRLIGNMQRAMDYLAARGIGMVHTVSGVGFPADLDISLEKWVGRSAQSGFQVRVFPQSLEVKAALKRGLVRIGGCFACALDGCFGSRDAAMIEPYEGSDDTGVLYYTDEQLIAFCCEANRAGLQIEMHAIGDAAFNQAARVLKAALEDFPREDHRHGIIHACLPTEEGVRICAAYGIHLPMQASFIDWPQEPDSYLASIMGRKRAERLNPLRMLWDAGVVMSAGSDAPCTDPDPILWMQRACNHSVAGQSLTPREALRMCTYNGAWTTFDEDARGSLETGKVADMVVLSENPYEVSVSDLGRIKVERLLLGGRPYRRQSQGFLAAVARGMMGKGRI
ncbi:amidohydrolase [Gordonibacter sp. Marseille-P4307]|uniref:amidohydrolase n=1 Tax=Gordonibacter sp. Marseille-P4307 TaxID=2161815 RepID=UPI000F53994C|nr:amidohydrolase family protein [Gordonibacter sp. Marseille-P4307]